MMTKNLFENVSFFVVLSYAAFSSVFYFLGTMTLPLWHIAVDVYIIVFLIYYLLSNNRYFNFDLVFYILFPFYFKISFILYLFFGINVFSLSDDTLTDSYFLCHLSWLFGTVLYFVRPKNVRFSDVSRSFFIFLHSRFIHCNLVVLFVFAFLISLFFLFQVKDLIFVDVSKLSRLEVINMVSQSGWFLKYFLIAYAWFISLYFMSLKGKNFDLSTVLMKGVVLIIPILIYIYTQQVLGGRRELVFIFLFIMVCFVVLNNGVISTKLKFSTFVLFTLLIYVGGSRHSDDSSLVILLTNSMGEFLFPISTFQYYNGIDNLELKAGVTYFYSVLNFIPKFIFPDKPLPLAVDFALLVANPNHKFIMGYAITPITEAYANFGRLCVLFFPLLLSFIAMAIEFSFKKKFMLFFILLSQCLNFQRSDIASIFFETVMMVVAFYLIVSLSMIRVKK